MSSYGRLEHAIEKICATRGIALDQGKAAFADLIAAMHELTVKARYPEGGLVRQTYFALGSEAAYHLGGVLIHHEDGLTNETLQRIDPDLKRFKATLDRWQAEAEKGQEDDK